MRLPGAFSWVWLVLAGAVLHVPAMPGDAVAADTSLQVYIGTYTGAKSRGIYWAKFDPVSGELSAPKLAAETRNPTFLALHPNRRFLYAAEEVENFEGKSQGAVSAYSVDEKSGRLSLLSEQPSGGAGPCHLCVDKSGKWLLVANYNNGSIAKLPIAADGSLGLAVATVQHQGASVNPERQAGPHAHFITTDPNNKFALVCDLGLDKVFSYNLAAFDEQTVEAASVKPGFGPRHLAFHPNGRFVFLLNELAGGLTAFSYEAGSGTL